MTNYLKGEICFLRALEPLDIDFLFDTENNEQFWEISGTQTPYSKHILKKYIENAQQDIYEAKQFRFLIADSVNSPVGLIDLFDFNPQHRRAGIGILILPQFQNKGYGSEALQLLINYSFNKLNLNQLYANILSDNKASIALFNKLGFAKVGVKKEWIFNNNTFKNEILYQLIQKNYEF
jgi:diamine N-acetyltransferase